MKEKQKLVGRNTCTPEYDLQVRKSVTLPLKRRETACDQSLKTHTNNPHVDLQSGMTGQDLRVPVINMRNEPLMPTTPGKAGKLIRKGKAKIISANPFAIQLLYATGETRQPITPGIDSGYKNVGFSAVTDKRELISGEAAIRTDIPDLNVEKSMYRRGRRNKLWYRQPRFMNRGNNGEEWFAPSIGHKLKTHVRLIEKLKGILPISKIVIEVASFDTQKMRNPEISGIEYQQGELQGYEIREYLLEKFRRQCVYCGKTNTPLEIEHLTPKSRGGRDTVDNLAIACHSCNQEKNNLTAEEFGHPEVRRKASLPLKGAAFMNNVRWKLAHLTGSHYTFGYITKRNRISLKMDKSHANDAFVIAGGADQIRASLFAVMQRRRNIRTLQVNRRGFRPSIRRKRYDLQPGDVVEFQEGRYSVVGMHSYGKRAVIRNGEMKMDVSMKKARMVRYGKGLQFQSRFIPALTDGVSSGRFR